VLCVLSEAGGENCFLPIDFVENPKFLLAGLNGLSIKTSHSADA
jgi:hypothetical protein